MRFAVFPVHLSKVLRLPRKIDARWYEVLHLSRKIILANRQIWCSKMQPLSGNQRPDLLTSLWWTCLLYCAWHTKCIFADPLQMSDACHRFWTCDKTLTFCSIPCACHAKRHLNVQKCSIPMIFWHFWLRNVVRATTACTFSTSQLPKVARTCGVFSILTSKCASRHNIDFEMSFAPRWRALFRHLNFQTWSEHGVFCTFWLRNVLRATTACNLAFSSGQMAPHPPL